MPVSVNSQMVVDTWCHNLVRLLTHSDTYRVQEGNLQEEADGGDKCGDLQRPDSV